MRVTIRAKLVCVFSILILLLIAIVSLGVSRIEVMDTAIDNIIAGPTRGSIQALTFDDALADVMRSERNMALSTDADAGQRLYDTMKQQRLAVQNLLDTAMAHAVPEDRPRWKTIADRWARYVVHNDAVATLVLARRNAEAGRLATETGGRLGAEMIETVKALVRSNEERLDRASIAMDLLRQSSQRILLVAAALALVVAIGGAWWVSAYIDTSLRACAACSTPWRSAISISRRCPPRMTRSVISPAASRR